MKQNIMRFFISLCLYWIVSTFASVVLVTPATVVNVAIFLPPILGLMWGPLAVAGTCAGAVLTVPNFVGINGDGLVYILGVAIEIFLSGYLPYFLWHNWKTNCRFFHLTIKVFWKLITILLITCVVTSLIRTLFVSPAELNAVSGLFDLGKKYAVIAYAVACFVNDFVITIFVDIVFLFMLIGIEYPFYNAEKDVQEDPLTLEEHQALKVGMIGYLIFPITVMYLNVYQIYGMEHLETWLVFIVECLTPIDVYLLLITYMLLRYRRSIMMEIVFLVAMTVFLSAAVLGLGSSIEMGKMVNSHVEDSLHEMSLICRERLDRTFFCIRQAVNGMERQAVKSIESYDRITTDAAYRAEYLSKMEQVFESIATDTDGCLAYYLRFAPEIEGTKGGFSMAREAPRWEGALAPFIRRSPIDLALYSPDDLKNVGWYYTPLESKCATWIEPYIDPTAKAYVISYVAPIFIEGKFIGVIGVDIDFNFIIHELRRMSIYDYGYVYLMNRNNLVLYHKDQLQGEVFQPNPDFKEMEIYLTNGMWLGISTPLNKVYDERNHVIMRLIAAILIVAMLVSLGSIILVSKAIRPLEGMTEAAKRIASGDLNVKISYESGNELGLLVRSIREMASRLEVYVYRDKLTGLRNVAAYTTKGNELDAQSKVLSDLAYAVILFDVNFLKKVNDNYGHQAGNQLIRHAARVICKVFRHSPVYRVGGDEFIAVLEQSDYEKRNELLKMFDRKLAEETFKVGKNTLTISVARGIGIYEQGMEFSEVAKKADAEMYAHKAAIKAKYGEEVR